MPLVATSQTAASAFVLLAVALLALAPAADARPKPALYFLKDAELSPGHRAPVGDGVLSIDPPPPINPGDPANATPPSTRVIYPYLDAVAPAQFAANASANTGRVFGVVAAYLFLPKTPALQSATLNVSLVLLPATPAVPPPLGGGGTPIAWARFPLDYENSSLPDPTTFADPGNVTNDPQAALNHTSAQLLAYGISTVYSSAALVFLDDAVPDYIVDVTVPADARLALRLVLENGTAIGPAPGLPVPVGAGQDIVYDFGLAFSLVLVPWYEADPPAPPRTSTSAPAPTATTTPPSGGGTSGSQTSQASVALPFGILVSLVVVAAWAGRRRL